MAVEVIDRIKPKNGGSFPVVEAVDVEVSEGLRLPEALAAKANTADVTSATSNLQSQIDQIAQAAGTGSADTEVAQARVDVGGTTHTTLKDRIDADDEKHSNVELAIKDNLGDLISYYGVRFDADLSEEAWFYTSFYAKAGVEYRARVRATNYGPPVRLFVKGDTSNVLILSSEGGTFTPAIDGELSIYGNIRSNLVPVEITGVVTEDNDRIDLINDRIESIDAEINTNSAGLGNLVKYYGAEFVADLSEQFYYSEFYLRKDIIYMLKMTALNEHNVIVRAFVDGDRHTSIDLSTTEQAFVPSIDGVLSLYSTRSLEETPTISIMGEIPAIHEDIAELNKEINSIKAVTDDIGYVFSVPETSATFFTSKLRAEEGRTYRIKLADGSVSGNPILFIDGYKSDASTFLYLTGEWQEYTPVDSTNFAVYTNRAVNCPDVVIEGFITKKLYDNSAKKMGTPDTTATFTVPINCNRADITSTNVELQDETAIYTDSGMIMLPHTYTPDGKPTRLAICCHGAGGSYDSQTTNFVFYRYLVSNGFAVMDMAGLPTDYADELEISRVNNVGSDIAMQCYTKGYEYVKENYNVYDEVVVFGASMGGIVSANIAMGGTIPVIACGAFCPVLDTYNEIWLHPWSSGAPKTALAKIFDFDTDGQGNYVYDEEKLKGFNPVNNHTIEVAGTKYTYFPCPVKYWHSADDNIVNPNITEQFVNQIRNYGGQAYFRKLASGGHSPYTAGEPVENPSGNTDFRGTELTIYPAVEEAYLWLRRFI